MKTLVGLFTLLFIVALAAVLVQNYTKSNAINFPSPFEKKATVTINKKTFSVINAKTAKEKEIGLSDKSSLDENNGMIFAFGNEDYYSFWMKNMKFPIDIIFIRKNFVTTVHENVQPPKSPEENLPIYKPEEPSDTVLEISAGLAKKYNINKGDEVKIENLK